MDSNLKSIELTLDQEIYYGEFKIGESIAKYLDLVEKETGEYIDWDSYIVQDSDTLNLWCSGSGTVYAIRFDVHCYYKGQDLIGMPILDFLKILNKEPYHVEVLWVPTKDDYHGQNQHVYDFDLNRSGSKGVEVWTWRKRIVSILVYDNALNRDIKKHK